MPKSEIRRLARSAPRAALLALLVTAGASAQERALTAEEMQNKCFAGRTELEGLVGKIADAEKRGLVILAIEEIAELEEDSAWSHCIALVEETLHKVK